MADVEYECTRLHEEDAFGLKRSNTIDEDLLMEFELKFE